MDVVSRAFSTLGADSGERSFDLFAQSLDGQWIEQALQATGSASVRRRKLPAEYVVWLVIAMGLLRDRSIAEVVRHLDLVLPGVDPPRARPSVTGGAIVQARDRLGEQPLEMLFATTADAWGHTSADHHRWRGLAVYGVDGSTLRVADSEENDLAFGRPKSGRGRAAYPQARIVALMVLRSHLLAGLSLGRCDDGEVTLACGPSCQTTRSRSSTEAFSPTSCFTRSRRARAATGSPVRRPISSGV